MIEKPYLDALVNLLGGASAVLNIAGVVALVWLKTQHKKVLAGQQHTLDVKYAEHEAALRAKYEKEGEVLRSHLQRVAAERHLLFSSAHQKREEILCELYRKLNEAIRACDEASRPGKYELVEPAHQKMAKLHSEMEDVAIYFAESFCVKWHDHVAAVTSALWKVKFAAETQTARLQEDRQLLGSAFNDYLSALRGVRTELRKEIRKIIGIERELDV